MKEAENSITNVWPEGSGGAVPAVQWVDSHFRWGREILRRTEHPEGWSAAEAKAEAGMLAVAMLEQRRRIRILENVTSGTAYLIDIGEPASPWKREKKRSGPYEDVLVVKFKADTVLVEDNPPTY